MITKGSQRGGAIQLAAHLLNERENDHVEILSMQGFTSNNLPDALMELQAISRATKCQQFMFSLSLSPPSGEQVTTGDFETAIDLATSKLGLDGQARVAILHTKKSRTHCHVVFSRIDLDSLKAVPLPFFKERLQEVSRELYLTHGWRMPPGLRDRALSNPLNFDLQEYFAAQRARLDPREMKATVRDCWNVSDSGAAFAAALEESGFRICRGDRRGYVLIHWRAPEAVYSLSRWLGKKQAQLTERIGPASDLPALDEARAALTNSLTRKQRELAEQLEAECESRMSPLRQQRVRILERQRAERRELRRLHAERSLIEAARSAARFRRGLAGIWQWVTGNRRKIQREIAEAFEDARRRDALEADYLRNRHRSELAPLHQQIRMQKEHGARLQNQLNAISASSLDLHAETPSLLHGELQAEFDREPEPSS